MWHGQRLSVSEIVELSVLKLSVSESVRSPTVSLQQYAANEYKLNDAMRQCKCCQQLVSTSIHWTETAGMYRL